MTSDGLRKGWDKALQTGVAPPHNHRSSQANEVGKWISRH
jgi:hypothetical protein